MSCPGVQVSAQQWALLIRVKDEDNPRDLAWELSESVFGARRPRSPACWRCGGCRWLATLRRAARRDGVPALLSFIRAVSGEKAVGRATGGVGAGPAPRGDGW